MADITADLNSCLRQQQSAHAPVVQRRKYNVAAINLFLQEAYSINARIAELTRELRAIRPEYLRDSAAPRRRKFAPLAGRPQDPHDGQQQQQPRVLTDRDREDIDANAKLLLRELNGAITKLQQAEAVRIQAADSVALGKRARGGLGALGRWAAGGAVTAKSPEEESEEAACRTVASVRESVILFLQQRLEEAGRVQSGMMDERLGKEVQKTLSVLAQTSTVSAPAPDDRPADDPVSDRDAHLTPEQLQTFAAENSEMIKHYEAQLDQLRTAERSILEISELHSTLHANLQQQSEHIDQLVQDSFSTTENLGKGNKELKRASERRSTAQAIFYSTVAFCSFLVVWDLVF